MSLITNKVHLFCWKKKIEMKENDANLCSFWFNGLCYVRLSATLSLVTWDSFSWVMLLVVISSQSQWKSPCMCNRFSIRVIVLSSESWKLRSWGFQEREWRTLPFLCHLRLPSSSLSPLLKPTTSSQATNVWETSKTCGQSHGNHWQPSQWEMKT